MYDDEKQGIACKCERCSEMFKMDEVRLTNFGYLCDECIAESQASSDEELTIKCEWCELEFEASELKKTDLGYLCDRCIAAIWSRGERVTVITEL
jgi:hypothetical protein